MPEIMNVTNPVPGYETATGSRAIPNSANDPSIVNLPNPSRVNRADPNAGQQQDAASQREASPLRYDSNFQSFLQKMMSSETVTAELLRVLVAGSQTTVSSGIQAGTATEMGQVLEMLNMNEGEFLQFLKDQTASSNRFNGPLFDLLRNAYHSSSSPGLRGDILQFLKRFSDFSSTTHIEDNLLRGLNRITASLPRSWGSKVVDLISLLQNSFQAGDRAGSLKLLQGEVLPFLSDYVSRSHDMGRVRSALTMLVLDIARYENGSEGGLTQALRQLFNYAPLRDSISPELRAAGDDALLQMLKNTAYDKAAANNAFADHLASAADQALRGSSGSDAQQLFQSLVSSILVNESVYMTVNHQILPLIWNGQPMYSEFWVDPDADRDDDQPYSDRKQERTMRFLFKADIQSLGMLDMVLTCRGSTVDLQVRCPDRAAEFSDVIQNALTGILSDNGLDVGGVRVEKAVRPLTVSEVFPKIFEGKDSVNVRV